MAASGAASPGWGHGPPARVEVRREGGVTTAVIHASVAPLVKGLLAAWLGAWALGESLALRLASATAENPLPVFHGFALLFLAGWTVMGLLAAHSLWWCHQGTEELSSDGRQLTHRRQVGGLGRSRRFDLDRVRGPNIRYSGRVTSVDEVPPHALVRLAFETRWSTHRVNASLRHDDALRVVAALAAHRPRLGPMAR